MSDWEEAGRDLQRYWLELHTDVRKGFPAAVPAYWDRMAKNAPFVRALILHGRGESSELLSYLRSPGPLNTDDRAALADVVETLLQQQVKQFFNICNQFFNLAPEK